MSPSGDPEVTRTPILTNGVNDLSWLCTSGVPCDPCMTFTSLMALVKSLRLARPQLLCAIGSNILKFSQIKWVSRAEGGTEPACQKATAVSITHVTSMECLPWLFLCRAPRIEMCKTREPRGPQGFPNSYCHRARADTEVKQSKRKQQLQQLGRWGSGRKASWRRSHSSQVVLNQTGVRQKGSSSS